MAAPALVVPTREQKDELSGLAYALDQELQARSLPGQVRVLGEISRFMDANPTIRLDDSATDDPDDDTTQLAVGIAVSTVPESIPIFQKMVKRQPSILGKRFLHGLTLKQYIESELEVKKDDVLEKKLGFLDQTLMMRKTDRLFGTLDKERVTVLPRGVQSIVREALTGVSSLPEQKKLGGRRKTRRVRKTRKTKTRSRKTK